MPKLKGKKASILPCGFLFKNAPFFDCHSGFPQDLKASSRYFGIGISESAHAAGDACMNKSGRAGRLFSVVTAPFYNPNIAQDCNFFTSLPASFLSFKEKLLTEFPSWLSGNESD